MARRKYGSNEARTIAREQPINAEVTSTIDMCLAYINLSAETPLIEVIFTVEGPRNGLFY